MSASPKPLKPNPLSPCLPPILAYHQVTNKPDIGVARTTVSQFRRQMRWLAESGFRTIGLRELVSGNQPPDRRVVLTFDDAYACIEDAAEIMDGYGFRGACFPVTEYIGRTNDWDYQFLIRRFRHAEGRVLQSLKRAGWEVGSHSSWHACLTRLSPKDLLDDLTRSRATLSDLLGSAVDTISYPFGRTNHAVCQAARATGFTVGVGLGNPAGMWAQLGWMCLPRLGMYRFDSMRRFRRQLLDWPGSAPAAMRRQRAISILNRGTVISAPFRGIFSRSKVKAPRLAEKRAWRDANATSDS